MTAEPMVWTREIPFIDPVAAAARLARLPGLAFLDSAMRHDTLGRVSVLAADPFARFRYRDGRATLDGRAVPGSPIAALRACLAPYRLAPRPDLPAIPGAIGYFAYDLGASLERVAAPARRAGLTDDIAFNLYDTLLAVDHGRGTCLLIATGFPEADGPARAARAQARLDAFADWLAAPSEPLPKWTGACLTWRSNFSRQTYESAVEKVRDYIRAGDIYQANIAQRFAADLPPGFDPFAFYRRLRETNPATFGAYLDFDGLTVASSSPERFLKLEGRAVETRPIKGTVARDPDPPRDAEIAAALQANPKERAENIMIVDLLRNDLSMVCEVGTVAVPALMRVESYATVHQLVSTVRGRLRDDVGTVEALRALFPAGSMTGAPKRRTMEVVAEVETTPRGVYAGALGWIGGDGRADLGVVIRTLVARPAPGGRGDFRYEWGTGGGITVRSDAASEYAETRWKAARLRAALLPGQDSG